MNEILEAADTLAGNVRAVLAERKPPDAAKDARANEMLRDSLKEYVSLRRAIPRDAGDLDDLIVVSLQRYADHHIETGGFLRAVLQNNLAESIGRGDTGNRYALSAIVSYCVNRLPQACWGTPEKVECWLAQKEAAVPQQPGTAGPAPTQ